jgi:hypothetical protein
MAGSRPTRHGYDPDAAAAQAGGSGGHRAQRPGTSIEPTGGADATWGDRAQTAITSGLATDAGIMAPDFFDYVYSMQDPEGPLHSSSASQLNPFNNPGRLTAGMLGGAGFGGVMEELGARFPRLFAPTGYEAETEAPLRRYPSLAPPKGRRRR